MKLISNKKVKYEAISQIHQFCKLNISPKFKRLHFRDLIPKLESPISPREIEYCNSALDTHAIGSCPEDAPKNSNVIHTITLS
jgi:hypothetical protein